MSENKEITFAIIRGDGFDINYSKYLCSEKCKKISDYIHEKHRIAMPDNGYTYRVINSWESNGLLNLEREKNEGWRKFSILDLFWLEVIKTLRNFGVSLDNILRIKNQSVVDDCGKYKKIFEYYLASSMTQKEDVFMIVGEKFESEFATLNELNVSTEIGMMSTTQIRIGFNSILGRIFKNSNLPNLYGSYYELNKKEKSLINRLKSGQFKQITVKLKDGEIMLIESKEVNAITKHQLFNNIEKIVKDSLYQEISIVVENGEVQIISQNHKEKNT